MYPRVTTPRRILGGPMDFASVCLDQERRSVCGQEKPLRSAESRSNAGPWTVRTTSTLHERHRV